MNVASWFDSQTFTLIVIPLFIFIARVIDVSLQTLRVVFVSKGFKLLAPMVGFFEVLIWILALGQIMKNLTNFYCYLAYAAGFAMGTVVGLLIEERLSIGKIILRIIVKNDLTDFLNFLKAHDFGVTVVPAVGATGAVKIIFTVINRKDVELVITNLQKFNPKAFYSIEDVRFASLGVFPARQLFSPKEYFIALFQRKGK